MKPEDYELMTPFERELLSELVKLRRGLEDVAVELRHLSREAAA